MTTSLEVLRPSTLALLIFAYAVGCKSETADASGKAFSSGTRANVISRVEPGPIRHPDLTETQMDRIRTLQQTFAEVDPTPLTKWVEDFKRDVDPERELRIYEGMADAYRSYCQGKVLSARAKSDVYQVVLLRSASPDADVLPRVKLQELSVTDAKEVLRLYRSPAAPITVAPSR